MAYKKINILGYKFKFASQNSWISFSEKEIRDLMKKMKFTKKDLESIYNFSENQKASEKIETRKIHALKKIEILGYLGLVRDSIDKFKKMKDLAELRKEFHAEMIKNKELADLVEMNQDLERSSIIDDFKLVEIKKIIENYPVFNIKLVIKFLLERNIKESLNFEIKKASKK